MARINTNIASLIAQSNLARSNTDLNVRLERLSTGLRINRGADDPAGLIVSERLRSEVNGLNQAIKNSERASSVIATAEGALAEAASLLNSIKSLVVESANSGALSKEELEANQLQIDSAIESITRIANTTSFAGLQLLNGSLGYTTSGVPASAITATQIHAAKLGNNASLPVSVEVVGSAQSGELFLSGNTAGSPGALLSSVTLEVAGTRGVTTLSFVSGAALSSVVAAVNTFKDSTGVSASLVDAANQTSGMVFNSLSYGSEAFVSVEKVGAGGDFFEVADQKNGSIVTRDEGQDVLAVVNGALGSGRGLEVSVNTSTLGASLKLDETFAQTTGVVRSFDITGGGSVFQLGPTVNENQQVDIGISSIVASRIGGTLVNGDQHYLESLRSGGAYSLLDGDFTPASDILDNAITEISVMRGRLGAFERNTLDTNLRSMQVALENITASESKIRDADFAAETAALTRAQILTQAGTSVLATANASSQNVLALLQ